MGRTAHRHRHWRDSVCWHIAGAHPDGLISAVWKSGGQAGRIANRLIPRSGFARVRRLTDSRSAQYPVEQNRDAGMAGLLTRASAPLSAFPVLSTSDVMETGYTLTVAGTVEDSRCCRCTSVPLTIPVWRILWKCPALIQHQLALQPASAPVAAGEGSLGIGRWYWRPISGEALHVSLHMHETLHHLITRRPAWW